MNLLDVSIVVFAIAFIVVMVRVADSLTGTEDEDGYNLERGVSQDHDPSREQDASKDCQRATGCGNAGCKPGAGRCHS